MSCVHLLLEYPKIFLKITTTTVMGVTGSFHTITFHGFLVSTASSVWTSPSVVVRRSGCVEAILQCPRTVHELKVMNVIWRCERERGRTRWPVKPWNGCASECIV